MPQLKYDKDNKDSEQKVANASGFIQNRKADNASNAVSADATPISDRTICTWLSRFYYQHPVSSTSFTVLNNNFAPALADKPNAIVHPMKRSKPTSLTISSEYPFGRELHITPIRNAIPSNSSSNAANVHLHSDNFVEELKRKLHQLHSKATGGNSLNQRPLFITTVPRGRFLPPPPTSKDSLQHRKRNIYVYSSHPIVYKHPKHPQQDTFNTQHNKARKKFHTNDTKKSKTGCYYRPTPISNIALDIELSANHANNHNDINKIVDEAAAMLSPNNKPKPTCIAARHKRDQPYNTKRENPQSGRYQNVMHDKRVIRGSNFGANAIPLEYNPFDRAAESRRRIALRKKNCERNLRNVLGTPPPVPGRLHETIQTEKYLEELEMRPVELDMATQTDLFLCKPFVPPYVPAKIGVDASTEIPDGDLFHFEAEAQPIIDVLVDNTIEVSLLEVAHEREIACIRQRQNELLARREAELAELRRLEAEEMRLQAEKQRRIHQESIVKSFDLEMQKEVTTAKLLQGKILDILPDVLENLEPAMDNTKKDKLYKSLGPWISEQVANEVDDIVNSRDMLTLIIKDIVKKRAEVYADYKEETQSMDLIADGENKAEEEYECESNAQDSSAQD